MPVLPSLWDMRVFIDVESRRHLDVDLLLLVNILYE